MTEMRLFVSYTRRDGQVTTTLLSPLRTKLERVGVPFIHESCHEDSIASLFRQQVRIILELLRCDVVILLDSPLVYRSPWVRFELALARLFFRPVLILNVTKLAAAKVAV